MLFSQIGRYALRVMATFAIQPEGTKLRSQDLIDFTSVPPAYLSKVLRKLVESGLLNSQKGHHGGFSLAKASADIPLGDVLRAVDTKLEESTCVFGWGACGTDNPCPMHPLWAQLSDSVLQWSETTTLAAVMASDRFDLGLK